MCYLPSLKPTNHTCHEDMSQKERLVFNPSSNYRCKLLVSGREYMFFLTWTDMNPGVQDPVNFKPACFFFVGGSEVQDHQTEELWRSWPFSKNSLGNNSEIRDLYEMDCKTISPWKINISHLGKRKIIFKMPILGDMLVPWRVHLGKLTWEPENHPIEKENHLPNLYFSVPC